MLILYILLGIYAISVIVGLAYPTFMEGVSEGRGEPYFIKTSEIEETQTLLFFWPSYIILAVALAPIVLIFLGLRKIVMFIGHRCGKRQ